MDELAKLVITLAMVRAGVSKDAMDAVWEKYESLVTDLLLDDISMGNIYDQVLAAENSDTPQGERRE